LLDNDNDKIDNDNDDKNTDSDHNDINNNDNNGKENDKDDKISNSLLFDNMKNCYNSYLSMPSLDSEGINKLIIN
jgi:hypothetical protein